MHGVIIDLSYRQISILSGYGVNGVLPCGNGEIPLGIQIQRGTYILLFVSVRAQDSRGFATTLALMVTRQVVFVEAVTLSINTVHN